MEDDQAKLFTLILIYLSEVSLDAIKKGPTSTANSEELWKLVEQKHKAHTASKVKEIT